MMTSTNKRYTQKFNQEAVRLLLTGNKSAAQLGRELGESASIKLVPLGRTGKI